ncbi:MAG: PQQ-binding-like beta-propeller repeat protein [Bdellovibrionales bacterium]|nr:PQQ-binding-like beta-propeller repeat protein [Bdellovibrionales bacterium]
MYDQPSSPYRIFLIPILLIFWGFVIVTAFRANPFLFQSQTLINSITHKKIEQQHPFPKPDHHLVKIQVDHPKELPEYQYTAPDSQRWSRKLALQKVQPLNFPDLKDVKYRLTSSDMFFWSSHSSIFYARPIEIDDRTEESSSAWSFQFVESEIPRNDPLITDQFVILTTSYKRIVVLVRKTGQLLWSLTVDYDIQQSPALIEQQLLVSLYDDETQQSYLKSFDLVNGTPGTFHLELSGRLSAPLLYHSDSHSLFVATEERELLHVQTPSGDILWKHTTPSKVVTQPNLIDDQLLINTADQTTYSLKLMSPEINWDYKLKGIAQHPFIVIPSSHFVAVMTDGGYLHTIDYKTGKGVWRFNTQAKAQTSQIAAVRFSNQVIEERELKWHYKGWSIWAPCVENRICMFNPSEGNLIGRLSTAGELASMPLFSSDHKRLLILLKNAKDQIAKKAYDWGLGSYIELSQYKQELEDAQKKAEEEKAQAKAAAAQAKAAAAPTAGGPPESAPQSENRESDDP